MHELSLISNVMETIKKSANENGIVKITKIKIVVGEMTAALPEALKFGFSVLSKDTMFEGAELIIEEKEVVVYCNQCYNYFKPNEIFNLTCPHCGCNTTEVIEGKELSIEYFEGDEEEDKIESNNG